jgi:uncharacterized protein (TIGR02246 family)
VVAWNHGNAKAYSERFAEDGSFTNVLGTVYYGHEAFEKRHAAIFDTVFKGSTLQSTIAKLRFIRPDVAIADVDAAVTNAHQLPGIPPPADGVMRTKLQMVFVKEKGAWWITAYHNVAVVNLTPRQ